MTASDATEHASESTPLLQPTSSHDATVDGPTQKKGRRSELFIVSLLLFAILTIGTGDQLIQPAQTRIVESIYCRQYYKHYDPSLIGSDGGDGVAEKYCKNHVIQGEVAMLRGWQITIEAFVMLLVSVPWGYAADVYGRKPILVILLIGLFFRAAWIQAVCWFWWAIPIKAVWGAGVFAVMGGGSATITAILYTIIADVIPEERRVSTFFQIGGAVMATQVIGPFASAALMQVDPWIPMLLGLGLQLLVVLQSILLPETKDYLNEPPTAPIDAESDTASAGSSKCTPFDNVKRAIEDSITFLAADLRLIVLLPAFFAHMLVVGTDVLLQYISTRYSLSLANATFILTLHASLIVGFMLLAYPAINHLLRIKFTVHAQLLDLLMSRFCLITTGLGYFFIALAPSIPLLIAAMAINTLGSGVHLYLRSLSTSFVEPHHLARLMTIISWVETVGVMVGSPLLAWMFERGIDLGGMWVGLPFLFCAGVYGFISVLVGSISLSEPQLVQEEEEPLTGSPEESASQ